MQARRTCTSEPPPSPGAATLRVLRPPPWHHRTQARTASRGRTRGMMGPSGSRRTPARSGRPLRRLRGALAVEPVAPPHPGWPRTLPIASTAPAAPPAASSRTDGVTSSSRRTTRAPADPGHRPLFRRHLPAAQRGEQHNPRQPALRSTVPGVETNPSAAAPKLASMQDIDPSQMPPETGAVQRSLGGPFKFHRNVNVNGVGKVQREGQCQGQWQSSKHEMQGDDMHRHLGRSCGPETGQDSVMGSGVGNVVGSGKHTARAAHSAAFLSGQHIYTCTGDTCRNVDVHSPML